MKSTYDKNDFHYSLLLITSKKSLHAELVKSEKVKIPHFVQNFLSRVDKKDALLVFIVFYCFAQNYDMHNNSCQYKKYAASI